jgi:hypothetical protein
MRLAACVILSVSAVALAASVGPVRSRAASGRPGLEIVVVTETTSAPALPVSRRIEYIQSDRRRSEVWDGRHAKFVSITRCDLSRTYIVDLEAGDYDWMPLLPVPTRGRIREYAAWWGGKPQAGNPTHLIELETRDTGERKMVFGREARHVITTRRQKPIAQGAVGSSEFTIDGWYIDLDTGISCEPQSTSAAFLSAQVGHGPAIFSFKTIGKPEGGFMVEGETTSRQISGGPNGPFTEIPFTVRTQLTLLNERPLAASLFEIPPGFQRRRVPFSELLSRYWSELKAAAWHLLY